MYVSAMCVCIYVYVCVCVLFHSRLSGSIDLTFGVGAKVAVSKEQEAGYGLRRFGLCDLLRSSELIYEVTVIIEDTKLGNL